MDRGRSRPTKVIFPLKKTNKRRGQAGQDPNSSDIEEEVSIRKRKANSTKEGSLPAYNNVILVHPPKDVDATMAHVYKLAQVCNGDIDWSKETLDEDMEWFRNNRGKIMEAIPPVTVSL
jgi:hypothetical protein